MHSLCGVQAMQFWRKAERVVQYKQQVVTNARKKEVMDKHLDFLVGQTQRYSTLLAQRLAGMLLPALPPVLSALFSSHGCLRCRHNGLCKLSQTVLSVLSMSFSVHNHSCDRHDCADMRNCTFESLETDCVKVCTASKAAEGTD